MTEQEYLDQAETELEELNRKRANFMADTEPVTEDDILPKLIEIAEKLRNEDTRLNVYELWKHPDARAKLFSQITKACYMMIDKAPSQGQRLNFGSYLEGQFQTIVKKVISQTDTQALGELVSILDLDEETKSKFVRDMAVSGLLAKEE